MIIWLYRPDVLYQLLKEIAVSRCVVSVSCLMLPCLSSTINQTLKITFSMSDFFIGHQIRLKFSCNKQNCSLSDGCLVMLTCLVNAFKFPCNFHMKANNLFLYESKSWNSIHSWCKPTIYFCYKYIHIHIEYFYQILQSYFHNVTITRLQVSTVSMACCLRVWLTLGWIVVQNCSRWHSNGWDFDAETAWCVSCIFP